jgi:hypothetical protein
MNNSNALRVVQTASMIYQMTDKELQLLAECIIDNNGEELANYISMVIRDRDYMNIEVQEPVC